MQDRSDSFNYVELDIKLEQSIQRETEPGRHRRPDTNVMVEFELISREILLIQNNCRKLTNERMMEHHKAIIYQKLRSIKAVFLCECLASS